VQNVIPGSPADAAGIIEGDIIRRVGSLQLLNTEQLRLYIKEKLPGQKIRIVFLRNELTLTTYATLEISQINNPDTKLVYGTFP
jgi:S1-C subfamily serine protease